jgi:hypothetical protein
LLSNGADPTILDANNMKPRDLLPPSHSQTTKGKNRHQNQQGDIDLKDLDLVELLKMKEIKREAQKVITTKKDGFWDFGEDDDKDGVEEDGVEEMTPVEETVIEEVVDFSRSFTGSGSIRQQNANVRENFEYSLSSSRKRNEDTGHGNKNSETGRKSSTAKARDVSGRPPGDMHSSSESLSESFDIESDSEMSYESRKAGKMSQSRLQEDEDGDVSLHECQFGPLKVTEMEHFFFPIKQSPLALSETSDSQSQSESQSQSKTQSKSVSQSESLSEPASLSESEEEDEDSAMWDSLGFTKAEKEEARRQRELKKKNSQTQRTSGETKKGTSSSTSGRDEEEETSASLSDPVSNILSDTESGESDVSSIALASGSPCPNQK